jgi:hypothetical protein
MIRKAKKGEQVITSLAGRVISDIVVQDDTSWVVKAPTKDLEEYVLSQSKFESNWNPEGCPPKETNVYKNPHELFEQGYNLHYPKLVLKWLYRIQDKDLYSLDSRKLQTSWGALQTIVSGDYLALPYPEANASEIYIIPKVVVDSAYVLYNQHHSVLEHSSEIVGQLKSLGFARYAYAGDISGDIQALIYALKEPYNLIFRYQIEETMLKVDNITCRKIQQNAIPLLAPRF